MTLETRIDIQNDRHAGQTLAESVFGLPIGEDLENPDINSLPYEPSTADVTQAETYVASHGSEDLSPIMYRMLRSLPVDYGKDEFNSLSMYIHEIMEFPLLDADGERSLFQQVHKGLTSRKKLIRHPEQRTLHEEAIQQGLEAEQYLIMANTRWVFSLAKRFQGGSMELLDLIQEGNIGLHRALKKFDLKRGTRFSTYATCWIRHTIQTALEKEHPMHISRDQHLLLRRIRKAQTEMTHAVGRSVTVDEIATTLGIEVSKVVRLTSMSRYPISLDQPKSDKEEDGIDITVGDSVSETHTIFQIQVQPETEANHHMLRTELLEAVRNLPERERNILFYRNGMIDGETHTLEETGAFFGGVTRERIRQLENQGIARIPEQSLKKLIEYLGKNQ